MTQVFGLLTADTRALENKQRTEITTEIMPWFLRFKFICECYIFSRLSDFAQRWAKGRLRLQNKAVHFDVECLLHSRV